MELQKHQKNTANYVLRIDVHGVIVYHGLGSGKTLTSIDIATKLSLPSLVIVPASLIENYKKEIQKYKGNKSKFTIVSFEKSAKMNLNLQNKILIIDEAHRLRNQYRANSKKIIEAAKLANKVILLTGTPLVNRPSDIASLANIVANKKVLPINNEDFKSMYVDTTVMQVKTPVKIFGHTVYEKVNWEKRPRMKNKEHFENSIKGLFSFYENEDKSMYPATTTHFKPVSMSHLQSSLHTKIEESTLSKKELKMLSKNYAIDAGDENAKGVASRVNAYLSKTRQVSNMVNGIPSPKVLTLLEHVRNAPKPVIVYSNYLNHGVVMFSELCKENDLSYRLFTGSVSNKHKKQIVQEYNSRKFDVLLLSRSGSEGLDLKATREIHIMEPYWNNAQLNQVIGRGVRYKSHINLPINQRHVAIFYWYSIYKKGLFSSKISSDSYLINMSKEKTKLMNQFKESIKKMSVI